MISVCFYFWGGWIKFFNLSISTGSEAIEVRASQPVHLGDVHLPIGGFIYYHIDIDASNAGKTMKITMVSVRRAVLLLLVVQLRNSIMYEVLVQEEYVCIQESVHALWRTAFEFRITIQIEDVTQDNEGHNGFGMASRASARRLISCRRPNAAGKSRAPNSVWHAEKKIDVPHFDFLKKKIDVSLFSCLYAVHTPCVQT